MVVLFLVIRISISWLLQSITCAVERWGQAGKEHEGGSCLGLLMLPVKAGSSGPPAPLSSRLRHAGPTAGCPRRSAVLARASQQPIHPDPFDL